MSRFADFHAREDDTENWGMHAAQEFASPLRFFEFCLGAVTHDQDYIHGLRKCLSVVVRQYRRNFDNNHVRQISGSSNDAGCADYQLSAVGYELTQRYGRDILDEGRLHPNSKIH